MNATAMEAAINAAVKAVLNGKGKTRQASTRRKGKKGKGREKLTDAEKAVFMAKNDAGCIETFTAAGYKDVQPRVNVMTYDKWISNGRRVKKGEKSLRVGPFNLFIVDQTEPLAPTVAAPTSATVQ